jgi:hypothetical protein
MNGKRVAAHSMGRRLCVTIDHDYQSNAFNNDSAVLRSVAW